MRNNWKVPLWQMLFYLIFVIMKTTRINKFASKTIEKVQYSFYTGCIFNDTQDKHHTNGEEKLGKNVNNLI